MKHPETPVVDDPARVFAFLAAEAVCEVFLPGAKLKELPALQAEMVNFLRKNRDSQPETIWIVVRSMAPTLGAWPDQPRGVRLAIGAFRDVLVAMDKALAPEPAKPPALPPMPTLKSAMGIKKPMRSIFDR